MIRAIRIFVAFIATICCFPSHAQSLSQYPLGACLALKNVPGAGAAVITTKSEPFPSSLLAYFGSQDKFSSETDNNGVPYLQTPNFNLQTIEKFLGPTFINEARIKGSIYFNCIAFQNDTHRRLFFRGEEDYASRYNYGAPISIARISGGSPPSSPQPAADNPIDDNYIKSELKKAKNKELSKDSSGAILILKKLYESIRGNEKYSRSFSFVGNYIGGILMNSENYSEAIKYFSEAFEADRISGSSMTGIESILYRNHAILMSQDNDRAKKSICDVSDIISRYRKYLTEQQIGFFDWDVKHAGCQSITSQDRGSNSSNSQPTVTDSTQQGQQTSTVTAREKPQVENLTRCVNVVDRVIKAGSNPIHGFLNTCQVSLSYVACHYVGVKKTCGAGYLASGGFDPIVTYIGRPQHSDWRACPRTVVVDGKPQSTLAFMKGDEFYCGL